MTETLGNYATVNTLRNALQWGTEYRLDQATRTARNGWMLVIRLALTVWCGDFFADSLDLSCVPRAGLSGFGLGCGDRESGVGTQLAARHSRVTVGVHGPEDRFLSSRSNKIPAGHAGAGRAASRFRPATRTST